MWLELVLRIAETLDSVWSRTVTPLADWWYTLNLSWPNFDPSWLQEYRSHHYVSAAVVLAVFWPVVVTLIMALTAASTWVFWLVTSVAVGIIQMIYVTYQFTMITLDIMGLSALKTFSMIRSQVLYYLGAAVSERKSRRRIWRARLNEAKDYQEFLKIPIEPKDAPAPRGTSMEKSSSWRNVFGDKRQPRSVPPPPSSRRPNTIARSSSFGNMDASPRSQASMIRNKSFHFRDSSNSTSTPEDSLQLEQELGISGGLLLTTTSRLREARTQAYKDKSDEANSAMEYLLSGVVKRNHLKVEDFIVEDSRSVVETGKHGLSRQALNAIGSYYEEVEASLRYLAESPVISEPVSMSPLSGADSLARQDTNMPRNCDISDRISFVRKMKHNMGRTALMLSGGGAQAMYHLGTIRALAESKLYDDIKVISGTSGGSISAAMCAIRTSEELLSEVCVETVSTDFLLTGEMKKHNIRWFPPVTEMGAYWLKHRLLVDSEDFKKCCNFYYGDITFEEAFERTGKHVCITVSASRATGATAQRLLLNHISTPHVTLASAVAASCALPGVMKPAKLMAKRSNGKQFPFEVDGVEWIDGSVQADLPFQRISTLFNVSNYIVCQVNFHVVPLLNKPHHPSRKSFYWQLFQTLEWDIRSRALKLSRLGLFPKIFGQDMSKVFRQKYHGNLTLVPRFTTMQTFGLKTLTNPTVHDMKGYLENGQMSTWPYLEAIGYMVRIETAIDKCLAILEERNRMLSPDIDWSHYDGDDIESISSSTRQLSSSISSRVRFYGISREADHLKEKINSLELENKALKEQLEQMQKLVQQKESGTNTSISAQTSPEEPRSGSCGISLNEKDVWNLIRRGVK